MLNHLRLSARSLQTVIVVLVLTLLGCYLLKLSDTSAVEAAMPSHPTPQQEAAHIVVQLFQVPGFIYPSVNGVPEWTLYADGLLIFKASNSSDLMQVRLSPDKMRSILNVIVRQNSFFASTHVAYGRPMPDVGSLLLNVDINGIHKQVRLFGEPPTFVDAQTRNIFAIKKFLNNYHPATAQPYISPGIALLAIPQNGDSTDVPAWPYKDISLAQTAAQECPFLSPASTSCPSVSGVRAGVLAIFGPRAWALLQQQRTTFYAHVKEQGKLYRLVVWPLLPDALYPRKNGTLAIQVQGGNSGTWPLVLGASSKNNVKRQ